SSSARLLRAYKARAFSEFRKPLNKEKKYATYPCAWFDDRSCYRRVLRRRRAFEWFSDDILKQERFVAFNRRDKQD
ncbi:MAG: hypothetical protein WA742_06795, partial [Candidatus Cybelea sp.]